MTESRPVVLVVEDEGLLAMWAEEALREGGYDVLVAGDGEGAMASITQHGTELAGLVTDIRLGEGPDGWEVARAAREANHAIPVVYMTGDSAADWAANGVPKSGMLQKPFTPTQLLTALASLQNEQDSSLE